MVRLRRHLPSRQAPSVESVSGCPINTSKFRTIRRESSLIQLLRCILCEPGQHAGEAPNLEDNDCGAVRA